MKGRATAACAAAVMLLGAGSAWAAGGATVETFPVSFEITSEGCPKLPPDTTVDGSGTEKSITNTLEREGLTTIVNSTHASGTATDQDGNTYVFSYSNSFRATNSLDDPSTFAGQMTDHFSLSGSGPADLSNGFVATLRTDFVTFFELVPIQQHGDPIAFPEATAICDPL